MSSAPETTAAPSPLELPVSELFGVGPARARAFERLGVRTVRDLLLLLPRRVQEAGAELPIAHALERPARDGGEVTVRGTLERLSVQRFGGRSTLRLVLRDATGSIPVLFFNQPWMKKQFVLGTEYVLRGRMGVARGPALLSPRVGTAERPLLPAGALQLVYPAGDGLSPEGIGRLARTLAERCADEFVDPLAPEVLAEHELPPLARAVRAVHAPASLAEFERARRRLALEPLLTLQARLFRRRQSRAETGALAVVLDEGVRAELLARLPFELTAGQRAVQGELAADLARGVPMRRLLQGDVGTGKTVLGVWAALAVARAAGQTAFLAPTELLAEQHFEGQRELLRRAGLHGVLLTGSIPAPERRTVLAQLESGLADVVFGTHALFSADLRYRRLALAVIDEQQRFGVAQRAQLIEKGERTHVLLMTATPIPRTLALTLYGDLDTSVLRERPAGRGTVRTRWVKGHERKRVQAFLEERIGAGEQVYWVAPRIGAGEEATEPAGEIGGHLGDKLRTGSGSGQNEQASAERAFAKLSASPLAASGIELVHGRLDATERAARLARFRSGAARLLVATTVIEVGIDVPNATVMVIENAERLGLAQLHQLRGRIGRGKQDGWCLLFGKDSASERFRILDRTNDGFEIAEADLRARGMGDLAGLRQAGLNAEGLDEAGLELLFLARDLVAGDERLAELYLREDRRAPVP